MKLEITTEKGPRLTRVTEAAIQIQDGEDLREVLGQICSGARDAVKAALAAEILAMRDSGTGEPWFYTEAVYADFAIVEGCFYAGSKRTERMWRVSWTRAADGSFSFGTPQEVREVTTYEPVSPPPATPVLDPTAMESVERKAKQALGLLRQAVTLGSTVLRADAERTAESLLHGAAPTELQPVREALAALRSGDRSKVLHLTAAAR